MTYKARQIKMPKIPRAFIDHAKISQVLYFTINEFNYEERVIIYLYCLVGFPISKIASLTELSSLYIVSALTLFSEKLVFKLTIFKKAVKYDADDLISIGEMLAIEGGHDLGSAM